MVLVMSAKGRNDQGSAAKLKKALEIAQKYNPVNLGNMTSGNLYRSGSKGVFKHFTDSSIVHTVLRTRNDLDAYLNELKDSSLGMSVVVSGLFNEVFDCSRKSGLKPHTIQYSLGVFGDTGKLPPKDILEITTMCGHHLVSPALIKRCVRDIKRERLSLEEAARILARQCLCGVFNPMRAERLLESLAAFKE